MNHKIIIKTKLSNYKISIEENIIRKYLTSKLDKKSKYFIIVDSKIYYKINKIVKGNKNINLISVKASEKIKSVLYYDKLISKLLLKKIDRASTIIAIGGGTIGDLSGFVASTIMRGVKFILMPTTLLSQVDSSIGGKNGINTKFGKNLIGTFYQPNEVIIDPNILRTLPLRQIKTGYAEIIKHSLIKDKTFYSWLKVNSKKIYNLDNKALIYAITKSIKIKSFYVKSDEKEKLINSSSRAMLNFGHTFGHAIELMNNYKSNLTHGEAISIGMIIAAKISYRLKKISINKFEDIYNHFKDAGLEISSKRVFNKKFFDLLLKDKKNYNNKINLVLLQDIGKAYYERNLTLDKVKKLIL
tara:strand:+ start:586 stop:1656 length:1071 start_codon:yes stop_codon:yes gene_type:complete